MKKLIAILLLTGLFTSCNTDDVQDRPIIEANLAPELIAPEDGTSYSLNFENPEMQVDRFVWKLADFGGDVQTTYSVEIDNVGNAFANPQILGSVVGSTQLSFNVATLNNIAITLGATPFTAYSLEGRVKAEINGIEPMYSETVTFIVTPYTTEAPKLAVPGNHQGWDPPSAPRLEASGFGETDYEGYVWLDGGHKFVAPDDNGNFNWGNTDWGDDGTFSGFLAEEGETDCSAIAGYYFLQVDTEALTYSETMYNWGLIGSATPTGWDSDTDMVYDSATKTWTLTLDLIGGEFIKFRANDGWDWNYGDDNADGSLENGGADIAIASSGTYTVVLDLSTPRAYTYSVTLN